MADAEAAVQSMAAKETWREFDATVAWLRAHGRPALDRSQALEEAVQDWLGAQWAEHNRGEAMAAPEEGRGDDALERFLRIINKPVAFHPRPKR